MTAAPNAWSTEPGDSFGVGLLTMLAMLMLRPTSEIPEHCIYIMYQLAQHKFIENQINPIEILR